MADEDELTEQSTDDLPAAQASQAGIVALLPVPQRVVLSVAPTVQGKLNTLRPALRPRACFRIDDQRFAFDSSFISPDAAGEFALLSGLRSPSATGSGALRLTVFGHADPSGDDPYNKTLSGRRASAVYGLLVRDLALWEELYSQPFGGDKWGIRSIQIMLQQLGHDTATSSGVLDRGTETALKQFQTKSNLPLSGAPTPDTRKQLFADYMDSICRDENGPFRYQPSDFLSQGSNADGKGDRQGCGEFNPVLVFSKQQAKELEDPKKKAQRDADNLSNRRVVVYMFSPSAVLDLAVWPCPTVKEGIAGCKAQFFADGEQRRSPQENPRQYLKRGRTFSCRFYDRLARGSPCEAVRQNIVIFLLDQSGLPSRNASYRLTSASAVREGKTDDDGRLVELQVLAGLSCEVEWSDSDDDGSDPIFPNFAEIFLNTADDDEDARITERRLFNLGYRSDSNRVNRREFQAEYGDDPSDEAIKVVHESGQAKKTRLAPT